MFSVYAKFRNKWETGKKYPTDFNSQPKNEKRHPILWVQASLIKKMMIPSEMVLIFSLANGNVR